MSLPNDKAAAELKKSHPWRTLPPKKNNKK
jgi:hypothetical protein